MDSNAISGSGSLAAGVIKDATGAQLITKTLDRMNMMQTGSGPQLNPGYDFQKTVLQGAGIGVKLDAIV